MKKISNDEYNGLASSRGHEVIEFILKLGLQESCLIEPGDWIFKSSISGYLVNRFATKGIRFEVKKMVDKKGWIVKRIS